MNRSALIQDLVRDEGIKLHAYEDSVGFLTIGIGRLIDKRRGGGITQEEAFYLAGHDIDRIEADLDRNLPWWRNLSEPRQRVLANMCFNLGIGRLLDFKITLGHVQAGRYVDAAREMLKSAWATQVGERAERLSNLMRGNGGDE